MAAAGSSASVDIPRTFGALLLGASTAFGLSGIVTIQCVVYYKQYPRDSSKKKTVVLLGIAYGGHNGPTDSASALLLCREDPALQNNWIITAPIVVLAFLRLGSATITTANMIRLKHLSTFLDSHFSRSLFTTGLSLSAAIDVLITGWLCYFLREVRSRIGGPHSTMMIRMVDTLTLYTLENGLLTCFAAIASLICWLTMPHNLIFMGLHFVISKLYANSLLASLNMRNDLRHLQGRRVSQLNPGHTTGYQHTHDQGPESMLRIQNSKSLGGNSTSEYDLSDMGGGKRQMPSAAGQQQAPVVIQFRAASPSRWNALQPSVDLTTAQERGVAIAPTSSTVLSART
ncbi:hypothetical protein BKA70DRAFT_1423730 [Coprinopsis sp. MPI-PUGE-AT-0042]|nr:hypothetical protein BKA70DRAFT_1423730 [Coprinopsis sp. MPI-PUGE-AT-0042]